MKVSLGYYDPGGTKSGYNAAPADSGLFVVFRSTDLVRPPEGNNAFFGENKLEFQTKMLTPRTLQCFFKDLL